MTEIVCPECRRRALLVADGDVTFGDGDFSHCNVDGSLYVHGVSPAEFSDSDRVDAVQRAADHLGEPLGVQEYNEWARGSDCEPSKNSLRYGETSRFESWSGVCRAAGVAPKRSRQSWDSESVRETLRRVGRNAGTDFGLVEYRQHRGENTHLPASSTIQNHLDSWEDARAAMRDGVRGEIRETQAVLEDAGLPPRRAEIASHVIVRPERYTEIAKDLGIAKDTVGSQVSRYREARQSDKMIRKKTPPIGRERGRRSDPGPE